MCVSVCVYVCVSLNTRPTPPQRGIQVNSRSVSANRAMASRSRNEINSGIGRQLMASPGSSLAHRSTENLQDCRRNMKQRARQKGSTWFLGSWNERSLLDYEGPVETARQYLHLRVETKHKVYQACALSILLYGAECWTPLRKDLKRLDSFHHT